MRRCGDGGAGIFAVPTFAIFSYFAEHAGRRGGAREKALLD